MRSILILCVLISAALAGCGGGGGSSSGGGGEPPGGGNQPTDRLAITASASTTPVPSYGNTEIDFTVSNPGSAPVTDVVLTVSLGNGITRAGINCTATAATCPGNPDATTVPSLPAGGSLRFRMGVIVAAGTSGTVTSQATVTAADDPVTTNNSVSVSFTAYSADLNIVGSTSAGTMTAGSSVPYSITVSNAGPDAARDIELQNTMSVNQTLASMTCVASGGASCPASPGATMSIPLLPSGGALIFSITGQLGQDAIVAASTTMRATLLADGNFTNNQATVSAYTRIPTSSNTPSFIVLQSDPGDYIGDGRNYSYTQTNAVFNVYEALGYLHVEVDGDENWRGAFYMPAGVGKVTPGTYIDARGAPFHDPATGGMSWTGEARACNHSDRLIVDDVSYAAGVIVSVDIRFEQTCERTTPTLRGQIHWVAGDATRPPGPVNPPPAGLWTPAAGATPASGNYVYLNSDPGDFIGQGRTETYTQANSVLSVSEDAGTAGFSVVGNRSYGGGFQVMVPLTQMAPGYYAGVQRADFGNPAVGRMDVGGDGRGCNVITGWFVIDSIAYSPGGDLIALDMRFEQHCEGNTPALRGAVHWRSGDPTQPAGPQVPPPAGLWSPPANAIPASGNFVYLAGDTGDYIANGLTRLFTPLDSIIEVGGGGMTTAGNRFQLTVSGDEDWSGFFQAMNTLPDLQPGYYGNLQGFPFHNPAVGGIEWSGEGRGCNQADGWFVIDSVTYSGSSLQSITLRFEQHCEHVQPALRGMIRWSADDTRLPAPPLNPPPANLWQPPVGSTPATGNYLYMQSDAGDFIGQGQTHVYTPLNAQFLMTVTGSLLDVEVKGDKFWRGLFRPMAPFVELQPGFYDLPNGSSFAKGWLDWFGDSRGCNDNTGWFAVDSVSYIAGSLTSVDLRFEQHCEGGGPALHGKLHWRADDATMPPGPLNPPPAGLWEAPANVVPASGSFFYLTSDLDDYIGLGGTYNYTPNYIPGLVVVQGVAFQRETVVGVSSATLASFSLSLTHMHSIPRLQPGYYPNAQISPLGNPTVGGLHLSGNSHGCTTVEGWFNVHSVAYSGETLTALDVTFEQHCNGAAVSSRGRIRWSQ